jgi:hypothetical protein
MRYPPNNPLIDLIDRFRKQMDELIRNLADSVDDLMQEQYRDGYLQGFANAAHNEIRHDDEGAAEPNSVELKDTF